jgi:hypothetical protein
VVTLREPVERLYSLYRLKRASGKISDSFEEALQTDHEMRESGRYGHHLAEWISIFGRERALILIYEDLKTDPQGFVDQLCDFFEVDHFELSPEMRERENSAVDVVAPHYPVWTRIGVNASEWMRSHRYDRTMSFVHRLGIRRLFLKENGAGVPRLDPYFARELRERLLPEVEAVEKIVGRELIEWRSFDG